MFVKLLCWNWSKEITMTFRSLVGNVLACLGTGLCMLTVVIALQQNAQATICTGCRGCSGESYYDTDGNLVVNCTGGCNDPGYTSLCDESDCRCKPNIANSGCNCSG